MKAQDLYFNFYPSHFMNGVRGMSAQEVGVYTMLLCRIYEVNGPVEFHQMRLATYCGMRQATFSKTVQKLVELGKLTIVDGMLSNDRAECEISSRADKVKIAIRAGKSSAQKRQQNQSKLPTDAQRTFNHREGERESSSSSARESDDDSEDWTDDRLLDEVMAAVGIRGPRIPTHWMPPGATAHVGKWRRDLALRPSSIVDAARKSRANHTDPPNGPKALDATMRSLAAILQADPMTPSHNGKVNYKQSEQEQKMKRWHKIAGVAK